MKIDSKNTEIEAIDLTGPENFCCWGMTLSESEALVNSIFDYIREKNVNEIAATYYSKKNTHLSHSFAYLPTDTKKVVIYLKSPKLVQVVGSYKWKTGMMGSAGEEFSPVTILSPVEKTEAATRKMQKHLDISSSLPIDMGALGLIQSLKRTVTASKSQMNFIVPHVKRSLQERLQQLEPEKKLQLSLRLIILFDTLRNKKIVNQNLSLDTILVDPEDNLLFTDFENDSKFSLVEDDAPDVTLLARALSEIWLDNASSLAQMSLQEIRDRFIEAQESGLVPLHERVVYSLLDPTPAIRLHHFYNLVYCVETYFSSLNNDYADSSLDEVLMPFQLSMTELPRPESPFFNQVKESVDDIDYAARHAATHPSTPPSIPREPPGAPLRPRMQVRLNLENLEPIKPVVTIRKRVNPIPDRFFRIHF